MWEAESEQFPLRPDGGYQGTGLILQPSERNWMGANEKKWVNVQFWSHWTRIITRYTKENTSQ